ncbi:hypothetical protein D3C71_1506700 [compost metagenome]
MRNALAHGFDHARAFHADGGGHVQGVQPRAVVHVDEVQADGVVADADLAGAGLAHGDVNDVKFFGTTVLADLDGKAHGKTLLDNGC